MIKNRKDYSYYMECDRVALHIKRSRPKVFGDTIWKYERALRKLEYCSNCKSLGLFRFIAKYKLYRLSMKTGFQIGINVADAGLSLAHIGTVIINKRSIIGKNCRIQTGVTLGSTNGSNEAPRLGDNVFLGEGAKIIGNVTIADNVAIGANAVVVKNITESGTTWGGVPARKISDHSSAPFIVKATDIVDATAEYEAVEDC